MPKLILLQDIEDLGNAGDIVNISEGYARNFLIPKGYAVKESKAALRQLAARKEKIDAQRKIDMSKAEQVAAKIVELDLVISVQASDDNQLFGSVSASTIVSELAKHNIEVDARKVLLEHPIKEIGEYTVKIRLHKDLIPELKLKIQKA